MTEILDDRDVLTALEAFAELPDWLADVMAPGRVAAALRRAVPRFTEPGVELRSAVVDRLRAKGDEWHVRCLVEWSESGRPSELVLVGRLLPPGWAPPAEPATAPFGGPGWRCYLPDLRLHLEAEEADPALPALPALVDAGTAATVLQQSLHAAGHDVEVADCVPQVVRYKPGSRCTIVYRMSYRGVPGPDPLVVKTHQGDKGRTAFEAMRALWASPVARDGVVTLAEPLAYLPEERVLVQGPVPEQETLKELARRALTEQSATALDDLRGTLARTAGALAALHRSGARYGRLATWADELAEVREVVARLASTVPRVGAAADPLLRRLTDLDASVAADPPVSAHSHFRPAQVLLHEGRIGFIDFDGSCPAEPALDLGRFRDSLRDIGIGAFWASGGPGEGRPLERHLRLLDELCDDFLAEYRRHAPVTAERVVLWEVTDLLTGVLHAWTKVRTARVAPRLALLRHAAARLPASAAGSLGPRPRTPSTS
jgi:aminoglycoside phosphotransferase (APT) family kinase protein